MKKLILVFAIVLSVFGCSKPADVTPVVVVPIVPIVPVVLKADSINPIFHGTWKEVGRYYTTLYYGYKAPIIPTHTQSGLLYYTITDFNRAGFSVNKALPINPTLFDVLSRTYNKYLALHSYYKYDATDPKIIRHTWSNSLKREVINNEYFFTNFTYGDKQPTKNKLEYWNDYLKYQINYLTFVKKDTLYEYGSFGTNVGNKSTTGVTLYVKQQ